MSNTTKRLLISIPLLVFVAIGLYNIPAVNDRFAWRWDELRASIRQAINPPDENIFQPAQQAQLDEIVQATLQAISTPTPLATQTPIPESTLAAPTPTVTATPLPARVSLQVPQYSSQCNRWNYCGPANLTMILNYWGWKGDRDDVALVVKPGVNDPAKGFIERGRTDLNVMPYEMVDFVNNHTQLRALYRYGGTTALLKTLLANGYPVIIEKGFYQRDRSGKIAWMGHYAFVTGYDTEQDVFFWQDSYPNRCQDTDPAVIERQGRDVPATTDKIIEGWRSFNYVFIVLYPVDKQEELLALLGPWAEYRWSAQNALEIANNELDHLTGNDQFFAWFNKGTSEVRLLDYGQAARSFDYAFQLYAMLGDDDTKRPYRMMWYQTGPYWAYFYTGRFQDVVNLANITLESVAYGPTLEESLYWRAMAQYALGNFSLAAADMRESVRLNPNFSAGWAKLREWGIQP